MSEPYKCVTARRLPLIFAASKNGRLPEEVEEHITTCTDCMDALIALTNKRVGLAPVSVVPETVRTPSEPAQDAYTNDGDDVETVVAVVDTLRPVSPDCWSDSMIRCVATRLPGTSIHPTLFNHMSDCRRCADLQGGYRNDYLQAYERWLTFCSRFMLAWLLNLFIRIRFVRLFMLSRELRRRSSM